MYEVDKTRTHDDSPSHDEKYTEESSGSRSTTPRFVVGIFVEFVHMFCVMGRL